MKTTGLISQPNNNTISLTCCESRPDIHVDGKSLYEIFSEGLPQVPGDDDAALPESAFKEWKVRYVVQPEPFKDGVTFDDLVASTVHAMLHAEHVTGCYSEWTCGTGGWDFVLKGAHSILTELGSYVGQYVWLETE